MASCPLPMATIQKVSAYFDRLVDMMPAKHYLDHEQVINLRYMTKQERQSTKAAFKKQHRLSKQERLDPDADLSTTALQKRREEGQQASTSGKQPPPLHANPLGDASARRCGLQRARHPEALQFGNVIDYACACTVHRGVHRDCGIPYKTTLVMADFCQRMAVWWLQAAKSCAHVCNRSSRPCASNATQKNAATPPARQSSGRSSSTSVAASGPRSDLGAPCRTSCQLCW